MKKQWGREFGIQRRVANIYSEEFTSWALREVHAINPELKFMIKADYDICRQQSYIIIYLFQDDKATLYATRGITSREMTFTKIDFSRVVLFPMVMQLTGGQ